MIVKKILQCYNDFNLYTKWYMLYLCHMYIEKQYCWNVHRDQYCKVGNICGVLFSLYSRLFDDTNSTPSEILLNYITHTMNVNTWYMVPINCLTAKLRPRK